MGVVIDMHFRCDIMNSSYLNFVDLLAGPKRKPENFMPRTFKVIQAQDQTGDPDATHKPLCCPTMNMFFNHCNLETFQ